MIGIQVNLRIHADHLGLSQHPVLLVVALVAGLNVATLLGGEELVQYVGVVVKPRATANCYQRKGRRDGQQSRQTTAQQPQPVTQGVFRATPRQPD